ncbi:hypothetical protein BKA62DRAFT_704055 [Auriculariales sp. MPI-PUGE-AT-0066]|nr:hypothetical protein BKA62DRAFT_704055 [Auriculariales sp. MPI-PUGE-AT-0066]
MIIDGRKYACVTCIKGHRSSSCSHTERPLHEVKPKGRPITQCDHCRDLRKTRQVHVKCNCNSKAEVDNDETPKRKKPRKASPPPPTFPNGLDETQSASVVQQPVQKKRRKAAGEKDDSPSPPVATPPDASATLIDSLIQAAAGLAPTGALLASSSTGITSNWPEISPSSDVARMAGPSRVQAPPSAPPARSCCNPPPASERPITAELDAEAQVAALVASLGPFDLSASILSCSCGEGCQCPGCIEHRGLEALSSDEACPTSCTACFSCVISSPSSVLPSLPHRGSRSPEPPLNKDKPRSPFALDPTNVTIYSPTVWQNDAAARAVGLVKVPKLCCGGKCACPPGQCRCLDDCCGCCTGCACPEHARMPHFSGYQGPLKCGYKVSGVRGSCCQDEDEDEPAVPPAGTSLSSFDQSMSQHMSRGQSLKRPAAVLEGTDPKPPSISSLSRSLSRQRAMSSSLSSPTGLSSLTDASMSRIPFQPVPGPFTLGSQIRIFFHKLGVEVM